MKLFLIKKRSNVNATADYNEKNNTFTVLKGSIVSEGIAHSEKFRGAKSIEKSRDNRIENSVLMENVTFKSASTAANFVTGSSTNGLVAWKDKSGKTLKEILQERE